MNNRNLSIDLINHVVKKKTLSWSENFDLIYLSEYKYSYVRYIFASKLYPSFIVIQWSLAFLQEVSNCICSEKIYRLNNKTLTIKNKVILTKAILKLRSSLQRQFYSNIRHGTSEQGWKKSMDYRRGTLNYHHI